MKNKPLVLKIHGLTVSEILESNQLIDEEVAAFCLNRSVATLQRDRHVNFDNPDVPYIKMGRSVRYEPGVIKKVIEGSRIGHLEKLSS